MISSFNQNEEVTLCFLFLILILAEHFNVPEEEAKRILNPNVQKFENGLREFLYTNEADDELIYEGEGPNKRLKRFGHISWLYDSDKPNCHNLWAKFKTLLKQIDMDDNVTAGKSHRYERITLSQFIFYSFLIGLRRRVVNFYLNHFAHSG
jgi:hypothetical protein